MKKFDFVFLPAKSMAVFIEELMPALDEEDIFNLGYEAGAAAANEFSEGLGWFTKVPFTLIWGFFIKICLVIGFGKYSLLHLDRMKNEVVIKIENHPVVSHAIQLNGKDNLNVKNVRTLYRGVYSAHGEIALGIKGCHLEEIGSPQKEVYLWAYHMDKDRLDKILKRKGLGRIKTKGVH